MSQYASSVKLFRGPRFNDRSDGQRENRGYGNSDRVSDNPRPAKREKARFSDASANEVTAVQRPKTNLSFYSLDISAEPMRSLANVARSAGLTEALGTTGLEMFNVEVHGGNPTVCADGRSLDIPEDIQKMCFYILEAEFEGSLEGTSHAYGTWIFLNLYVACRYLPPNYVKLWHILDSPSYRDANKLQVVSLLQYGVQYGTVPHDKSATPFSIILPPTGGGGGARFSNRVTFSRMNTSMSGMQLSQSNDYRGEQMNGYRGEQQGYEPEPLSTLRE